MGLSLSYVDKLQRANADDLAFYPLTTLAKAIESGHVVSCEDNGDPAGYLWFGALRGGYDVTIYQACVDYDSRRQHLGFGMVAELIGLATAAGSTGIRLKCASSAHSNRFWLAAGFVCTRVQPGGIKRGRDLNCYRTDIQVGLFTLATVTPSDRPIDLTAYNRRKREGEAMPSRFSRTHYGVAASPTATEFVWLIERGQPEGHSPTVWWFDDTNRATRGEWLDDAHKATRYATRSAAEAVIDREFTPPPSRGRPTARAIEHGFIPASPTATGERDTP